MKSLINFILICTGIVTIVSFFTHFNSSGDIAKDAGDITELAVRKTINTASDAWDSIIPNPSDTTHLEN